MNEVSCRSCGNAPARRVGPLPPARNFAGTDLNDFLPGGDLFECLSCHLMFRSPVPSAADLSRLYQQSAAGSWTYDSPERPDWTKVRTEIDGIDTASILDIGCYDGAFLTGLIGSFSRFGIELNDTASDHANASGISIVGATTSDLRDSSMRYDVITAFDIIEHVLDPKGLVADATAALAPGGTFYVGTGNTDSRSWRFMKHRYWYCANLEHISFVNPRWAKTVAAELGVSVAPILYYSHDPTASTPARLGQIAGNVLARVFPSFFATLRLRGVGEKQVETREQAMYPPHWASARDHVLLKFTAPE